MNLKKNVPLAPFTTIRIGGPAEFFVEVKTREELIEAVSWAKTKRQPFRLLGNGSNTLIPDEGMKGLIIKNSTSEIKVENQALPVNRPKLKPRYQPVDGDRELKALIYDENLFEPAAVTLDSGVFLPRAIFKLISQGITGLEWFAGIPATVGGATYINLHGGDRYWSDYLARAEILTLDSKIITVPVSYFGYDYDQSTLKTSGDIVLSVTLNLRRGPVAKALAIAKHWQLSKSHQPQRSLGCLYQNLSQSEQAKLNLPTPSVGYLIDKKLDLKSAQIGQARIADKHAGFVENLGGAKASDVCRLIDQTTLAAKDKLGINLKLEIVKWPN